MDTVLKATAVYLFLWAAIRLSGRRTLGEMTPFDFVVFLMIGSAMQRALTGQDFSFTNAVLIVFTLVGLDVLFSLALRDIPPLAKILRGIPTIIVEDGKPLGWRLKRARLTVDDVLQSARRKHGIESLDGIRFAILETSGDISIMPFEKKTSPETQAQQENFNPSG